MNINSSIALVTGANSGIGRAFFAQLLERSATKVYVAAGKSKEIAAGSLTQGAYQAFRADPLAFQARMSTWLPQSAR